MTDTFTQCNKYVHYFISENIHLDSTNGVESNWFLHKNIPKHLSNDLIFQNITKRTLPFLIIIDIDGFLTKYPQREDFFFLNRSWEKSDFQEENIQMVKQLLTVQKNQETVQDIVIFASAFENEERTGPLKNIELLNTIFTLYDMSGLIQKQEDLSKISFNIRSCEASPNIECPSTSSPDIDSAPSLASARSCDFITCSANNPEQPTEYLFSFTLNPFGPYMGGAKYNIYEKYWSRKSFMIQLFKKNFPKIKFEQVYFFDDSVHNHHLFINDLKDQNIMYSIYNESLIQQYSSLYIIFKRILFLLRLDYSHSFYDMMKHIYQYLRLLREKEIQNLLFIGKSGYFLYQIFSYLKENISYIHCKYNTLGTLLERVKLFHIPYSGYPGYLNFGNNYNHNQNEITPDKLSDLFKHFHSCGYFRFSNQNIAITDCICSGLGFMSFINIFETYFSTYHLPPPRISFIALKQIYANNYKIHSVYVYPDIDSSPSLASARYGEFNINHYDNVISNNPSTMTNIDETISFEKLQFHSPKPYLHQFSFPFYVINFPVVFDIVLSEFQINPEDYCIIKSRYACQWSEPMTTAYNSSPNAILFDTFIVKEFVHTLLYFASEFEPRIPSTIRFGAGAIYDGAGAIAKAPNLYPEPLVAKNIKVRSPPIHFIIFHTQGLPWDHGLPLTKEALKFKELYENKCSTFTIYNTEKCQQIYPNFVNEYLGVYPEWGIGNHSRGYKQGFWRWKPFVIEHHLSIIPEGEILVYHDCNLSRYSHYQDMNIQKIINLSFQCTFCDVISPFENPDYIFCKHHCKKELFETVGENNEIYRDFPLLNNNRIFIRNTELSRKFIHQWHEYCKIDSLLFPEKNPEPELRWHTHDQSIYSVLYKKYIEDG